MRYCRSCLSTDTRPNSHLGDDGMCSPCRFTVDTDAIDHAARLLELRSIVRRLTRTTRANRWQCLVGVSGGKDSTRQALWVREQLGLEPLLVSVAYPPRQMSQMGVRNISNLTDLGFDVLFVGPAPRRSRELVRESFLRFGNWARPTEMALFAGVPRIAIEKRIPLILWGENSALQVGETGMLGTSIWDGNNLRSMNTLSGGDLGWFVEVAGSPDVLRPYQFPSAEEIERARVQTIFLGPAWRDWSAEQNSLIAMTHGLTFRPLDGPVTDDPHGTSSIDDDFMTVNHFVKYFKFGFGRATDTYNLAIRSGLLSRDAAIPLVEKHDGQCPDEDIAAFCTYIGITVEEFWDVVCRFSDPELFDLSGERPAPRFKVGAGVVR
jgi:N-acetyl sugar amidotransferase